MVHLTSFLLGAFSFNTSCMLCKPNIELCIIERLTFSVVPKLIFCTRGQVPYATTINQLILPMAALGFAIGQFIRKERNASVGNQHTLYLIFAFQTPLSPPPLLSCLLWFPKSWPSCPSFLSYSGSILVVLFFLLFWRFCSDYPLQWPVLAAVFCLPCSICP